jgi:3-methyladenine DNA glycosylase AlkC
VGFRRRQRCCNNPESRSSRLNPALSWIRNRNILLTTLATGCQTPRMADQDVLTNQKQILENQKHILENQKTIVANQKTIQENQDVIKQNQESLPAILKNQEKILALLHK